MQTRTHRILLFVILRPWLALSFSAVMIASLAGGLSQLKMETDYTIFFDNNDPIVERFDAFQKRYGREDNLYIMMDTKQKDGVFQPKNLRLLDQLTTEVRKLPYALRVTSLIDYPLVRSVDNNIKIGPGFNITDKRVVFSEAPRVIRDRFMKEAPAVGRLISSDGSAAGIWTRLAFKDGWRQDNSEEVFRAARYMIDHFNAKNPGVHVAMTGSVSLDDAFATANQNDLMSLFPIGGLVMVLLSAIFMRSFLCLLITTLTVIFGVVGSLGFAGLANITLSSVSISAPTIVMIITIAGGVHLFIAYQNVGPKYTRRARVARAVQAILMPATLTTLTTCAGLLTLMFSPVPPFRDLGMISAFGVMLAWVSTFFVAAPLLFLSSPRKVMTNLFEKPMQLWGHYYAHVGGRQYIVPLIFVFIGISFFTFRNKLDDNYVKYFDKSFTFRTEAEQINKKLSGIYTLEYDLPTLHKSQSVYDPIYLAALQRLAEFAAEIDGVTAVDSFYDPLTRVQAALEESKLTHVLPATAAQAERNATLYEMAVPSDFDFGVRVNDELNRTRATISLRNISIQEINSVATRISGWLQKDTYWNALDNKDATGVSVIFSTLGIKSIKSMVSGMVLLFTAITFLMFLIFKKFWFSFACAAANVLPALTTLGFWGVFSGTLGMASAAVATVTLGIVIDDTIHFSHHFNLLMKKGYAPKDAVQETLQKIGPALVISSIVLTSGFSILSFSGFALNAALGLMVAITIVVALIFDIYILPDFLERASTKTAVVASNKS